MSSPLDRAQIATTNGDWSIIIDSLQQLSIDQINHNQLVLDLAFQVLVNGDFDQQWQIAKIIPKLGEIAIQPLLDLLDDQDYDLEDRWVVARILGDFGQPQVIAALIALISQNEDVELTAIATTALTKIGVPAIAALTDLLPTADRASAITILAQIRHSQTIEPLIAVIDDPDPQLRALVIESLGSFQDSRILPLLITKLTDTAAIVRTAAVIALSLRSDRSAEFSLSKYLRPLLFDLNLAVCQATALGLARFTDDQSVIVMLVEVLRSTQTPTELRSSVVLSLGWIGTKPAIDSLISALALEELRLDQHQILEIIRAIGKTDREQIYASQILANYLDVNSHKSAPVLIGLTAIVKQEIATVLGNLGNPQIVSDLVQLLDDPDDRVRLHTMAAISKLSPQAPVEALQLDGHQDLRSEIQLGI
jgi:HEAT repeat protein